MALNLRWPLPAVLAWLGCWAVFRMVMGAGMGQDLALGLASGLGVLLSLAGNSWWRRVLIAIGFPLSLVLSLSTLGGSGLGAWAWLLPLGLLALVYPLNAWRDAPLFPTPANALVELSQHAQLPEGAFVLDAGCGLGHGLLALRRAYPDAVLYGIEWSWPLRWLCALRCPWATVQRGDMWLANWSTFDMVYLFQRPESMPRAVAKAHAELRHGAWLVSLEFEAQQLTPTAHYRAAGGKMVWLYQAPLAFVSGE